MANLPPGIAKQQAGKTGKPGILQKEIPIPFVKEVPEKQVIEFTRTLAILLQAKLPLTQALETTIQQSENKRFKEILTEIKKEVQGGKSLSEAFRKYPKVFDSIYVQLSKVGELSGALDQIMLRLASYMEKAYKLKQRIRMAMVYPAIIVSVAIIAVTFLLIFVVPTFVDMYQDFDAELPGPTKLILSVSKFLTGHALWIGLVLALISGGIYYAAQTEGGSRMIDRFKLRVPYFGELYQKALVGQFGKTLATLLESGVTLSDSLNVLKKSSPNVILSEEIVEMSSAITKGKSLNRSLASSTVFPAVVVQMISVGEETASLDEMLNQVSDLIEEEVDIMVEGLTSIIEPILIVFIGVIIGAIIIALYLPIFELVNVVG